CLNAGHIALLHRTVHRSSDSVSRVPIPSTGKAPPRRRGVARRGPRNSGPYMPLSIYDVSAPVFIRGLSSLTSFLKKASAHATARKIDPSALLSARLSPDMFTFTRQVQLSSDFAKTTLARIAAIDAP